MRIDGKSPPDAAAGSMAWTMLSQRTLWSGFRRVVERVFRLPDGRTQGFEIRDTGDSVAIVALTKSNRVVLNRQYRPGPNRVLLEIPGGGIEPGEEPEQAAARELLEETGYAGRLRFVQAAWYSAYSTGRGLVFTATECEKVAAPKPDGLEFIEPAEMSLPEFRAHLRSGELTDVGAGYLALDFLDLL